MSGGPTKIGPYVVTRELDPGGQGRVFVCRHPPLGRDAILKTLLVEEDEDGARLARLRREAEVLGKCNHPNVVTVYDFFQEGAEWYLAMEYLPGVDLTELIRKETFTTDQALNICLQSARGLAHAHSLGIIHRDFKPSNVRVLDDGRVKVIDFGLARWSPVRRDADSRALTTLGTELTEPGALVGTIEYMSPEQTRGQQLDERTDIWSFGVTLLECLTRSRPFQRQTDLDTVLAIRHEDPRWDALPDSTPPRVLELLKLCLRRERDWRPPLMEEVVERLETTLRADGTTPARSRDSVRHNLPRRLSLFVGRDTDLERLAKILQSSPMVTLIGAGGCGKSRLATEFGWAKLSDFPGGVWVVELAALTDPALVPSAVAAVLGVTERSGTSLFDSLSARFQADRMLLILDNCEHLAAPSASLAERLLSPAKGAGEGSGSRILATSRRRLGVQGESPFRVNALELPRNSISASEHGALMACGAIRLFVERARLETGDFDLTEENAPLVVRICRRLSGVPLAIHLIAPLVAGLSLREIDERLEDVLADVRDRNPTVDERHRSVEASIECGYNRLSDAEKILLLRLAVFRGGLTIKAAEAVCADDPPGADRRESEPGRTDLAPFINRRSVMRLMLSLLEQSMIEYRPARRPDSEGRYDLLETIRVFARTKLEREGGPALSELAHRHMSYFLSFGKQAEPRLSGFADADWLNAVDLDLDNIRLALTTSERAGSDPDAGLAIITAVHRYFYVRGYLTEGRKLMDRALERSTGKADKLHAQALNARGVLAWRQGDFKQAESDYRASLEIWRVLGPEYRSTVANTLNNLGTLLGDRGEAAESRACHEEASAIFGELDDQVGAARLWLNWGAQEIERGNRPLARSLLGRAAPIFRAQSDWLREAIVESNLGQIDDFEGNRVEAVEHFRQSYVKFNEQDRLGTRITLARISACAHRAGRPEESAQLLLLAWPDDEDGRGVLARTVPEAAALWDQLNKSLGSDPIKPLSVETKSRRSTLEIIDGLLGSLGALERQPV